MKLNIRALSLTLAILFGLLTLMFTIWYSLTGYASDFIELLVSIYGGVFELNYNPLGNFTSNLKNNILNIFILTIFSIFDGLLLGISFGFLYNLFIPQERNKK